MIASEQGYVPKSGLRIAENHMVMMHAYLSQLLRLTVTGDFWQMLPESSEGSSAFEAQGELSNPSFKRHAKLSSLM